MRTRQWIALSPAVLVLAATVTRSVSARETETINQAYDTGAHPSLSIDNVNGDLTLEGWDKNRIELTAVKTASNQERLKDLVVECRKDGDRVTIRVKYPHENTFNGHGDEGPRVDFTVHVPRGTDISRVEFVNGDVEITNVEGDVEVSSVNGKVSGRKLGGDVNLSTVNGDVELAATSNISRIRLNSVNGDLKLMLPKKFDAHIEAGTLHGDITAVDGIDLDATKFTGTSMTGVIGKGTMKVDLNTVNGSIQIRHEGDKGDRQAD